MPGSFTTSRTLQRSRHRSTTVTLQPVAREDVGMATSTEPPSFDSGEGETAVLPLHGVTLLQRMTVQTAAGVYQVQIASTEPPSIDGGDGRPRRSRAVFGSASTEPPSIDGGDLLQRARPVAGPHASTEPPSIDGGDELIARSLRPHRPVLQRSRRRSTAVTRRNSAASDRRCWLQRSRRRSTAVTPAAGGAPTSHAWLQRSRRRSTAVTGIGDRQRGQWAASTEPPSIDGGDRSWTCCSTRLRKCFNGAAVDRRRGDDGTAHLFVDELCRHASTVPPSIDGGDRASSTRPSSLERRAPTRFNRCRRRSTAKPAHRRRRFKEILPEGIAYRWVLQRSRRRSTAVTVSSTHIGAMSSKLQRSRRRSTAVTRWQRRTGWWQRSFNGAAVDRRR